MFFDDQRLSNGCLHLYTDACNTLEHCFDNHGYPTLLHQLVSHSTVQLPSKTFTPLLWQSLCGSQTYQAVVQLLTSGSGKCCHIMSLVCYLFYKCSQLKAIHIPGSKNCASDHLSCLQVQHFCALLPQAHLHPMPATPLNLADVK